MKKTASIFDLIVISHRCNQRTDPGRAWHLSFSLLELFVCSKLLLLGVARAVSTGFRKTEYWGNGL